MQLGCIRTSFGASSGSISPNFGDPCLGKRILRIRCSFYPVFKVYTRSWKLKETAAPDRDPTQLIIRWRRLEEC